MAVRSYSALRTVPRDPPAATSSDLAPAAPCAPLIEHAIYLLSEALVGRASPAAIPPIAAGEAGRVLVAFAAGADGQPRLIAANPDEAAGAGLLGRLSAQLRAQVSAPGQDEAIWTTMLANPRQAGPQVHVLAVLPPAASSGYRLGLALAAPDGAFGSDVLAAVRALASAFNARVCGARFQPAAEIPPVGIAHTDIAGRVMFVNEKWCELTGTSPTAAAGRDWRQWLHPDDLAKVHQAARGLSSTRTGFRARCRVIRAGSVPAWMSVTAEQVPDLTGGMAGYLLSMEPAAGSACAVDADGGAGHGQAPGMPLLATISHELRAPLTSIVSFAALARETEPGLPGQVREYIAIIEQNAEHMLRLVGGLTRLSRIGSGSDLLDIHEVDIGSLVRAAAYAFAPAVKAAGLRLIISAGGGPAVRGDADRLRQVLDNLISNAIKFNYPEGVVEIRAFCRDRSWRIVIRNTGPVILDDDIRAVFDKFFRGSNANERAPGTGIGLTLAKAIVEAHGGQIDLSSTPGSGTSVAVTLPAIT